MVSDSSDLENENNDKAQDVFEITETKNYFIIMDGFGDSLREMHEICDQEFSFKTTTQIGIQLVERL